MRVVRMVLISAGGILFGLVMGGLILVAIAVQFLDYQLVRVDSDSMRPAYERGDLVVIQPVSAENIEDGDVILYRTDVGAQVMHRVIGRSTITTNLQDQSGEMVGQRIQFRFTTQGDANAEPDRGEVQGEDVAGRVWFSVPALGGADAFSLQFFLLLLAGVIILGWVSYEGYRFFDRREKKNSMESGETYTDEQT